MNQDIINYIKSHYKMMIGEKTSEEVKIEIGSALPNQHEPQKKIWLLKEEI